MLINIVFVIISQLCISQEVSNVHFEQIGKQIYIYYDLYGNESYFIELSYSLDGGLIWENPININGAIGLGQIPENNKRIEWDATRELTNLGGDIVFKVTARSISYSDIYIKNGNVFAEYINSNTIQLTFLGKDDQLCINSEKSIIYFVRGSGILVDVELEKREKVSIMKMDLYTLKQEKLMDSLYYSDWESSVELTGISGLSLTDNGEYLFYVHSKWTVSGVLVKLNTITKKQVELAPALQFDLLEDSILKNHIIVQTSKIKQGRGRWICYYIYDFDGNIIKEFDDDLELSEFIKNMKGIK